MAGVTAFHGPQETLVPTEGPEVGVNPDEVERLVDPIEGRYLVRLDPPMDRSRGGIIVPDKSIPQSRTGVVIKAGQGCLCEDGKTRMPMHAKVGQRILFEYAAGYSIPRVPETKYRLVRDGCLLAVVDGSGAWPEFAQPAEDVIPRLQILQDWLLVKNDAVQQVHKLVMPRRALTPAEKAGKRPPGGRQRSVALRPEFAGRVLILPSADSQIQGSERWTGVVVKRGPGLVTVTRCLDGDRPGVSKPMCAVGDRILYTTEFPFMSIPGIDYHLLVRERPCLWGVLGRPARTAS